MARDGPSRIGRFGVAAATTTLDTFNIKQLVKAGNGQILDRDVPGHDELLINFIVTPEMEKSSFISKHILCSDVLIII